MQISIFQSNQLKSIAILMMLFLHLFNQDYKGLFQPIIFIGIQPLSYYISLFCDCCVPIFAFVSGYGLFYKYQKSKNEYFKSNVIRIRKLYINYWVILFLFVVLLGSFLSKTGYPGNIKIFVLNFTAIKVTYNGAWWFLTTYLFFVISSSFWFSLLIKLNRYFYFIVLFLLYCIGFYFRIYKSDLFSTEILHWILSQSALYFCTLFQFMLGAFALHCNVHCKISNYLHGLPIKNYLLFFCIIILIIIHGLVPNLFIAPFTGILFVLIYCQLDLNNFIIKAINFFTPHATNMWLMHMFFYLIYFKRFIYGFKYVSLIYLVLLTLCIISSFVVNYFINKLKTTS